MFFQKFPYGPLDTNAILFGCLETKLAAVIDPAQGSALPMIRAAEKHGVKIASILLTHSHWDHIADLFALKQQTQASVCVHRLDAPNVEYPGSDGIPLFFPIQGVHPDLLFEEGSVVMVGRLKIEVIHTPGHSPGSVCFYLREQNLLFSGDTLFKGAIGNLHLPTGEAKKMRASLQKLAVLPPETKVVPGHGEDTTISLEGRVA